MQSEVWEFTLTAKYSLMNSGYVPPYYDVTSRKYFSLSLIMVLVVSSTVLVLRKSSFVILSVYDVSWREPNGEPIANPIKWKTYWYTGWWYVSYDTRLFVVITFMSTWPVGGCHDSLLGCDLHPLLSWSKRGSTLIALACPCVKRAYRSSFVCWHWHGHPGLFALLHHVLRSFNPFSMLT